jgi:hypothetical protein
MGCSQAGNYVLAQNTAVLRYAAHLILKKRAQKNASFSGSGVYVLAQLQLLINKAVPKTAVCARLIQSTIKPANPHYKGVMRVWNRKQA